MTPLYSSGALQFDDGERVGCGNALVVAIARAHPHMPRWRQSISPLRASGGSASPMAALRRVSYCVTTIAGSAGSFFVLLIAAFFFRRPLARSSWDVRRGRTSVESASRVRELARARPR